MTEEEVNAWVASIVLGENRSKTPAALATEVLASLTEDDRQRVLYKVWERRMNPWDISNDEWYYASIWESDGA